MRLRIISGKIRGRFINIPENGVQFRPTLERTRQSVAEIIKTCLPDAIVADVCAGSGAFGFEMVSRGAKRVDFVEKDHRRAELLMQNAKLLGIADQCRFISQDARSFVTRSKELYDVIFYDPPYSDEGLQLLVSDLLKLLAADGILVYERRAKSPISAKIEAQPYDIRVFGDTVVEFFHSLR